MLKLPGREEFRLAPKYTLQLVVFTVPTPAPEAYAGPVIRYISPVAGLVKVTDILVQLEADTEALDNVVLPSNAVSV